MMQDVHGKLNPGLSWQKQLSTWWRLFSPATWIPILRKTLVKYYIWSIGL